jgi:hypothetical protein
VAWIGLAVTQARDPPRGCAFHLAFRTTKSAGESQKLATFELMAWAWACSSGRLRMVERLRAVISRTQK